MDELSRTADRLRDEGDSQPVVVAPPAPPHGVAPGAAGDFADDALTVGAEPAPSTRTRRFTFAGSIRQRAARGTIINAAFTVGVAALSLLRAFVLARFVTKADYGVWGLLTISLGTILWLKQVGISDKFVQQEEPDQEAAFQKAFTLELLVTLAFAALMMAALPLIAFAYGAHQLIVPGAVCVAALVISVFQAPLWIHYRAMEYARWRLILTADPVVGFVVAVGLAVAGAGYWAFVGGIVGGICAATLAAVLSSPYKVRLRFERRTARSYLSFSWPIFVASAAALVMAQAAFVTARWDLGLAATGVITLSTMLTSFTERVDDIITDTLYPAICAVKDQAELLYESFVKSNRLALMWAVPFGLGLTLFCADLVHFGIGNRWAPAIVVLQVFGVAAAIDHVGFNWNAYFQARATTRPIAAANIGSTIAFLAIGIPAILVLGLRGYAIGLGVVAAAQVAFRAYYLQRLFDGFSFLAHALRAFLPTIPAVAAILLVRQVEPPQRTLGMALAELGVYIAITAVATWYLESDLLREAIGYVTRGRRHGSLAQE